jgi:hypothetical protein
VRRAAEAIVASGVMSRARKKAPRRLASARPRGLNAREKSPSDEWGKASA